MGSESLEKKELFPHAYGHEMELGILTDVSQHYDEPYAMADGLYRYLPKGVGHVGDMLTTGARLYVQGTEDDCDGPTNIEWASPECASVKQMAQYNRGGEMFSRQLAQQFAETASILLDEVVNVRMQMRVLDSHGSSKARHDNYGYPDKISGRDRQTLVSHLQTRSLVSGAGLVTEEGLFFSQKITTVTVKEKYGFVSSMFRVDKDPISNRLEVRCSDHNISDWATTVRIGSVALAIALGRIEALPVFTRPNHNAITFAKSANHLFMNKRGTITPTDDVLAAADYQQQIAELAMDKLPDHADMSDELFLVAYELQKYCEDFKAYIRGEKHISVLADRSDWAAKFELMMQYRQNDARFNPNSSLTDIKSRMFDLYYDLIQVTGSSGDVTIKEGVGYKLRKLRPNRFSVSEMAASGASIKPPENTRARLRVNLMKSGQAILADWDRVTLKIDKNTSVQIDLEHPAEKTIDPSQYMYDEDLISRLAKGKISE